MVCVLRDLYASDGGNVDDFLAAAQGGLPARDDPQQIAECFDVLLAKVRAIEDAFEQAFFVMAQLPYLQPFEDVNKRVSRLAANIPLIKGNLAPLSFVGVPEAAYVDGTLAVYEPNHVELLRDVFI